MHSAGYEWYSIHTYGPELDILHEPASVFVTKNTMQKLRNTSLFIADTPAGRSGLGPALLGHSFS